MPRWESQSAHHASRLPAAQYPIPHPPSALSPLHPFPLLVSGSPRSTVTKSRTVPVHRHALGLTAQFAIGGRADGAATALLRRAVLECHQLLAAEGLVVDLRRGLDQILQVAARQKVAQVDEFAVVFVFHYCFYLISIGYSRGDIWGRRVFWGKGKVELWGKYR